MPVYEYRCEDCSKHTEVHQSFTDDALTECPHCGGRLKKVFGNVGIAFKGSGFYVNDSGAKKSSTSAASGGDSAPSTGDASKADATSGAADTKVSSTNSEPAKSKKSTKPKAASSKD